MQRSPSKNGSQTHRTSSRTLQRYVTILSEAILLLKFKPQDEVRQLGRQLSIPEELVMRHPFPGPGLGIRIVGEVTAEKIRIAREADDIFISSIRTAGLYNKISQAYAALYSVKAVGVAGDKRVHEWVIVCLFFFS
jgi:GMP synthase PP-ATPase subunit